MRWYVTALFPLPDIFPQSHDQSFVSSRGGLESILQPKNGKNYPRWDLALKPYPQSFPLFVCPGNCNEIVLRAVSRDLLVDLRRAQSSMIAPDESELMQDLAGLKRVSDLPVSGAKAGDPVLII